MIIMNIFLTGEIQVGKSTIINKFLDSHKNLKVGGFRTISNFDENLGVKGGVYIVSASDKNPIFTENNHVGNRGEIKKGFSDKFNLKGVEFLSNVDDCDLILMDEIGFMESKAKEFSNLLISILDKDITSDEVSKVIKKAAGNLLISSKLFDVYTNVVLGDKKSMAYSLTFGSNTKTLTDDEINPIMEKIIEALEKNLKAELRK